MNTTQIKNQFTKPRIGVIGLGIMGSVMAETLLISGFEVCGYDIEAKAKLRLSQAGGVASRSIEDVVRNADVVITSLATSKALIQVTLEVAQAARQHASHAKIFIETSTLPIADKESCAATLKSVRISTMDCPVSGTAVRMKDRAWTIFASGAKSTYRKILPILHIFTDNAPYVGSYGSGSKMKFAANHLVAIYNVAYAESVALARKMGLDPRDMLDLFGNSAVLGTGVMRLRMAMMVERQYTPATMKIEVWQKDMEVIGDMAKSVDCPLPLFNACASIYTAAMAQGLALEDTASTAEVLGQMAGIRPKAS
jgi:3-hydroxyisobutyrate dehydrogenase-like beta-hydroxyacid dehydrogenase